jgi:plasmid stability protein
VATKPVSWVYGILGDVKTTIELPDELMREIKVRAAREDRKLKDLVAELLRRGLAAPAPEKRHRVKFPIIPGVSVLPGEKLTPERVHEILLEQEVQAALRGVGLDESVPP